MAENIGWISLHRQIQNHWIWKDPIKFQWWIDILLTVNTKECKVQIGNEFFICNRGESLMSIQTWATRWHVSKDGARNFLNLLEKDNMICRVSLGKTTRLSVCNYDSYQNGLHVKKPARVRTADTNNKEDNNNNLNSLEAQRIFRENEFKKTLTKFILSDKNPTGKYSVETVKDFFNHWSQWDISKNKMAWELKDTWELSKRLATWFRKESDYKPKQQKSYFEQPMIADN